MNGSPAQTPDSGREDTPSISGGGDIPSVLEGKGIGSTSEGRDIAKISRVSIPMAVESICRCKRSEYPRLFKEFSYFGAIIRILTEYLPGLSLIKIEPLDMPNILHEICDSKGRRYTYNKEILLDKTGKIVAERGTRNKVLMAVCFDSQDRLLVHQWVKNSIGQNRIRRIDPRTGANRIICDKIDTYFDIISGADDEIIALGDTFLAQDFKVIYRSNTRGILNICYHPLLKSFFIMEEDYHLIELWKEKKSNKFQTRTIGKFSSELYGMVPDPILPRIFAADDNTGVVEINLRSSSEGLTDNSRVTKLIDIKEALKEFDLTRKTFNISEMIGWHLSSFDRTMERLTMVAMTREVSESRPHKWFILQFQA
ncbi:hypothetical protein AAMO2058_000944800 [Amorphochlora amoebiformis]